MTILRFPFVYGLFAAIAVGTNLGVQWLILRAEDTVRVEFLALAAGTAIGLPIKYLLDKRWIFYYRSDGAAHDLRLFVLYAAMRS